MTLMPRDVAGRLGHETLQILRVRSYQAPSGRVVDLGAGLDAAAQGTAEYPPERQLMCAPGRGPQPSITVENAEDAALVRAEGIGYLQGYHLGPPTIERTWLGTAPSKAATMDRASSPMLGTESPAPEPGSSSRRVSAR